jgi:hypothetical protein
VKIATKHDSRVVTWQSANGETIVICLACQAALETAGQWPKDSRGGEYCRVSYGLHSGQCEHQD